MATKQQEAAAGVITRLTELETTLLPIERAMIPTIRSKKAEAAQRVAQFGSPEKLGQYPIFSVEPLTWRNKDGFPRLAVFSLESPDFELSVAGREYYDSYNDSYRRRWTEKISPKLPPEMAACYKDVLRDLKQRAKKERKSMKLRTQFAMLIPQEVRQKITEVRGEFKEILIVAEAPKWDFKQKAIPRPKNTDPLVVGYDGANYWLIAAFDPTPIEQYVRDEFCVKAD
jgi:hypothetical protein